MLANLILNDEINKCHTQKKKVELKCLQLLKEITKLSKSQNNFIEEKDNLILVWIKEKIIASDSISVLIIYAKAEQLFGECREANVPSGSVSAVLDFLASNYFCIYIFVLHLCIYLFIFHFCHFCIFHFLYNVVWSVVEF